MNPIAFRATFLNIIGNTFLFAIKLAAGLLSGSIALISEAMNSLNDIVSSVATFICVRISEKQADEGHPFGHSRAEPIAGIIIAILAGILGFEVFRESLGRLFSPKETVAGLFALSVPVVTIVLKVGMSGYFRRVGRRINSPALMATSVDSLMDVFVAVAALIGISGVWLGYPLLDPIAGISISIWIMYAGYRIGVENIDYLMGKAPPAPMLEEIKRAALGVSGVKDVNAVRAHYVGNFIHVEIHVAVDKDLSTLDSHSIGSEVEGRVEGIPSIEKSFIHIDPA